MFLTDAAQPLPGQPTPAAVALAFSIVATIAGVIFGALVGRYASG